MQISAEALVSLRALVAGWMRENVQAASLEEAEAAVECVRRACGEAAFEPSLVELGGRSTLQGSRIGCPCGGHARFVSYRRRWIKSVCAEAPIERAYYHCSACGRGQLPWDAAQGLNEKVYSPRLKALVAEVCGQLVYASATKLLERVGAARLEESSAEAIVVEVGGRLRAQEQATIEQYRQEYRQAPEPPLGSLAESRTGRLYIGMDAAKAHIDGSWHDVKVASLYEGQVEEGGPERALKIEYSAAQEPSDAFGWRVYAHSRARGLERFAQQVVIGDGAEFIWNQATIHFPAATQIVDFWHAAEHVWSLSRVLYGADTPQGRRWAEERVRSLKTAGAGPLLRALKRRKPPTAEGKEALRLERGYFQKNRERMDYPAYLARGMMIGSGPVEAGCKSVVGQRMKQAGMRWSGPGADAMLAVRACVLSQNHAQIERMARAA